MEQYQTLIRIEKARNLRLYFPAGKKCKILLADILSDHSFQEEHQQSIGFTVY
jgi:hypothetical protein